MNPEVEEEFNRRCEVQTTFFEGKAFATYKLNTHIKHTLSNILNWMASLFLE
jgi:hypothetical protein